MPVLKVSDGTYWRPVGCPGPHTLADDFNRVDGALGGPLTEFPLGGTWTVSSNQARQTTSTSTALAVGELHAEAADLSIDYTAGPAGASGNINGGLAWNFRSSLDFFAFAANLNACGIVRFSGGTGTAVITATGFGGFATYRVVHAVDGILTLTRNGVLIGQVNSPLHPGGTKAGILLDNPTSRVDNFTATSLGRLGRFQVVDGDTVWAETAAGEAGHPLRVDVSGAWTDVACIRVLAGPSIEYDTALYDTATYG